MPRFAANLSMLFTEVPFLDRFECAADSGFDAVEFQFPYAFDVDAVAERLERSGCIAVLHNLPAGDWTKGERGIACDPSRIDEFRAGVKTAIRYATRLNVDQLNCLAGVPPTDVPAPLVRDTMIANVRHAADALHAHDMRLLIEAINTRDVPGFFVSTMAQALDLIDAAGADNVFVQYDVYHAQRMEGELASTLERHLDRIAHVQIADNPGRHEPGTGEINFPFLFAHLDRIGYRGWVGCEYRPVAVTEKGLGWRDMARPT